MIGWLRKLFAVCACSGGPEVVCPAHGAVVCIHCDRPFVAIPKWFDDAWLAKFACPSKHGHLYVRESDDLYRLEVRNRGMRARSGYDWPARG